ncbi:MAG: glycosyltransferase family 2 protein [Desulfobacterales bacterium]|nr:glycosyltransferase family 2 protein [Desulfobacterales bacterium]
MNRPLVSVLITSYNREKYIAQSIESVLVQSMTDFELIITDNASTDKTLDIARSYESDPRVCIIANRQNIGQFPNRNLAAQIAKGKYLKYVDSDDVIYPHCIEVMTHMMERYPKAGMLLCSDSENDHFYPFELSPLEAYRRSFVHGERMSNSPLTTMFRKSAFDQIGGYENEKWPLSGDWDLILKIARKFPVLFAPTGLCFYRLHDGQMGVAETKIAHNFTSEGISISLEALRHPDCPLPDNEKKRVKGKLLRSAVIYATSLILKQKIPFVAARFLKTCTGNIGEWINLFIFQKPVASRPNLNPDPDWSDYPRINPVGSVEKQCSEVEVSVIILVRSEDIKLKSTIESVLVQSFKDFELLLYVADKNLLNIKEIAPFLEDPRVKLLVTDSCKTDLEMMNEGAIRAKGNYVKFLRAGIIMYPWALEHIIFPLLKKNAILAVECAAGYIIYPAAIDFQKAWQENFLRGGIFVMPPEAGCVKRDVFLKLGGFNAELDKAASHDMWLRLSLEGETVLPVTGLTTAYKGWEHPVPQAFMNNILPKQYKNNLCQLLESVRNKLDSSLYKEIMARLNMDSRELAKTERPSRMPLSADWSLHPWSKMQEI